MAAAGLRPCHTVVARSSTVSQGSQSKSVQCSPVIATNSLMDLDGDERKLVMSQQKLNLVCMIQFATSLMTALNGINKQSFQVFKLRIGVNAGPVIAGIIGAQRPFYDIWGDCVNVSHILQLYCISLWDNVQKQVHEITAQNNKSQIASRMESLGDVGRIQVEEKTAKLLMESLCTESTFVYIPPLKFSHKSIIVH